ncbi:MAG: MerR family transcriptional regulator [Deltaproteobacteria bacterium]|nr:MerR family transcriptional regulator [Deltaproteobacteria bacterium]
MTSDAAKILDRSAAAVILYERTGKLPAIKTANGRRLFRKEDVLKLARKLKREAGEDSRQAR